MRGEAGGSAKMAATIIESFFQRSLEDVVKGLRVQVIGEAPFLSKALSEVRKEMKSMDVNTKAVALQKLTYLHMLQGTDMGWVSFHIVEVMSMPKFSVKKIGYLAASQSFNDSTDVLLLITNLLRKDLCGSNDHEASLAIDCFSRVGTADLARDLLPEMFNMLARGRAFVKKKTSVALSRVFTKYPDAMRVALKRLIERLSDGDPSVVSAAINVLCDLARKSPKTFLPLAPQLYNLLIQFPNTWLCIKLVKMLGVMVALEPRLGAKIADPICELMRKSQATSLLLECIQAITAGLTEQQSAVELCVEKLNALLREDDTNVKYLCLRALLDLLPVHPWAVATTNEAIATCLNHRDPSIQQCARRLIIGMVSETNVIPTVHVLLQCAFKADAASCNDLVSSILSTCCSNHYLLVSNYSWYLSCLTEMAHIPHCNCGDEIGRQLVDISATVKSATGDVLRAGRDFLLDVALLDRGAVHGVLKAAAWIAGEYAYSFVNLYELGEALLQPRTMSLPGSVRALYVQAVFKVLVYSWSQHFGKVLSINTGIPDSGRYLAEKVALDQHILEAEFCLRQSDVMSEPDDFSALELGESSMKRPVFGCESQFLEESRICSRDTTKMEPFQASGDCLQALLGRQNKSVVILGEERGRAAECLLLGKGISVKEQQSWLGFLEPTFKMLSISMPALAISSDVEMQERACNLLSLLQIMKDVSGFPYPDERHSREVQVHHELLDALLGVLTVEVSSVSVLSQGRITVAEGLVLQNLDGLGPTLTNDEVRDGVIEGKAFPKWEGRKFFSFPRSTPPVPGESAVLLAQHRQRHENFYLRSEGKLANMSFVYSPTTEGYVDPEHLPRTPSRGSIPPRKSTKPVRVKARPIVVKFDDDDDHAKSSVKGKQRDLKDNFISSAIIDLLSGAPRPAHKYRPIGQHSNRLLRCSDTDNSLCHPVSSRIKDGSTLGRGVGPALAPDETLSIVVQEPGTAKPASIYRHLSHEIEIALNSSASGYQPDAAKLLRSSKGRARARRCGRYKGTSLSKTQ